MRARVAIRSVDRPVFLLGTGRSGSTILYRLLAIHPDLCWFSNLTARFPRLPVLAATQRLLDLPALGGLLARRIVEGKKSLAPQEGDRIFHEYCGLVPGRQMSEDDWNSRLDERLETVIRGHLRFAHRSRFLAKQTTVSQHLGLVDRIFPEARYVHIVRDGRAVAASLSRVPWWPATQVWWLGETPVDWAGRGRDPIELCALHWKRNIEEVRAARRSLGRRYLEVFYEDLVADVQGVVARILDFCQLGSAPGMEHLLPSELRNMNYKWKEHLSPRQIGVVERAQSPLLAALGYELVSDSGVAGQESDSTGQ